MQCAVIGAGAWGTALADLLARNGHDAVLWAREGEVVAAIRACRENVVFLPGVALSDRVRPTASLKDAVSAGVDLVVYAAPSHALRRVAAASREFWPEGSVAVVATKGIERTTLVLMSDVLASELPEPRVAVISGPSFAEEVAARQPTAVVAAAVEPEAAELVQRAFSAAEFRVYTSDDLVGVGVGGALKNVVALAAGVADGLGLGHNARAALITRGLAEMMRLGAALGARPTTLAGLAGVGDLVLTCTGTMSRNHAVGMQIGQGVPLDEALAGKDTVAEGVFTADSAHALAMREGVEMPIGGAMYRILYERQAPRQAMADLMGRDPRAERDDE